MSRELRVSLTYPDYPVHIPTLTLNRISALIAKSKGSAPPNDDCIPEVGIYKRKISRKKRKKTHFRPRKKEDSTKKKKEKALTTKEQK